MADRVQCNVCNTCDNEFFTWGECARCPKCGEETIELVQTLNHPGEHEQDEADRNAERGYGGKNWNA